MGFCANIIALYIFSFNKLCIDESETKMCNFSTCPPNSTTGNHSTKCMRTFIAKSFFFFKMDFLLLVFFIGLTSFNFA